MAYGKKYILPFKNRLQNDVMLAEIWQKDYADSTVTTLIGAETPVIVEWANKDTNLLEPINALEITLSFITDGSITIDDFFTNDDEQFRIDFCFFSYANGTGTPKLLYTTYMVPDGVTEPVTDQKHVIALKGTDNIALLKNVKWDETSNSFNQTIALGGYIREALQSTGLYSHDTTIDMSLPLRIYDNLFENTEEDRSDDVLNDPMSQTTLYPNAFQNDDESWFDCYEILSRILSKNATLVQADGAWNVMRIPEYQLFTDGEIPGTETEYNGSGTDFTAITLSPLVTIGRNSGDVQPVAEDQLKTLQRSVKYVQNTFEYSNPVSIQQANLQIPSDAVPYYTDTAADIRTDRYDIPTYFPSWVQRGGVTSYLEVKTDVATTVENEINRYIVLIGDDSLTGGVQFNPIPISAGDRLSFTLQYRTDTDTDDLMRFWVRFIMITGSATNYTLHDEAGTGNDLFRWVGPNPATLWDTDDGGIRKEVPNPSDVDTTEWITWDLAASQWSADLVPPVPAEDGILLIEVRGPNAGSGTDRQNVFFKDITFNIEHLVSESTQIVGHIHTSTDSNSEAKLIQEDEVYIDDSPRNTIAGTLFTSALTAFEYTDSTTGQDTNIGSVYFTRTRTWHRGELSEIKKLGNIITEERLSLKQTTRLIVDGTFKNVRWDADKFINPLCLFTFSFYPTKFFVASSLAVDYMACTFKARLIEIFATGEDPVISTNLTAVGDVPYSTTVTDDTEFSLFWDSITGDAWELATSSTIKYAEPEEITNNISVTIEGTFSITALASGVRFQIESTAGTIATEDVTSSPFNITFDGDGTFNEDDILYVTYTNIDGEAGSEVELDITTLSLTGTGGSIPGDVGEYSFKYKYDVKQ